MGKKGKTTFQSLLLQTPFVSFTRNHQYHIFLRLKTPTLFLLGAKDLRVPVSNGLQYARTLKERGVETKIIVFPEDIHGLDKPQSDYESFLNIGVWFKKYMCK